MAFIIADRVQDTTSTSGTGTITLAGVAPAGYRTFGSVCATNDFVPYEIYDPVANTWETGIGTYNSAGPTLTRSVISSSNSNALVSFAGNATTQVWLNFSAQRAARVFDRNPYCNGADGNVTQSSSVTLSRDWQYNTLTCSTGCAIYPAGWRIYAQVLDLTAAPAGSITYNGPAAGNASGAIAGTSTYCLGGALAMLSPSSAYGNSAGTAGVATGNSAASSNGFTNARAVFTSSGLSSVTGGKGGVGSTGTAGTPASANSPLSAPIRNIEDIILPGLKNLWGAWTVPGCGGTGGTGDGTNSGGGGGGGGVPVPPIVIIAEIINRGGSTATGAINGKGNNGGNGATPTTGNCGGGAGGSGSQGAIVFIIYDQIIGTTASNAVDVTGGNGGTGGNGVGTGLGGQGGMAGWSGQVVTYCTSTGLWTNSTVSNTPAAPSQPANITGSAGATATSTQVSL